MLPKLLISFIVPMLSFLTAYSQMKEMNAYATSFKANKISQYAIYETIMQGDSTVRQKYKASVITLNPDGTIHEEADFDTEGNAEGFISKYEYRNGNLVRQITDWVQQQEHDITEYEYENGLLVREKEIEAGLLVGWHSYHYDKKGKIIGATYYNADGKPDTLVQYEYQNGLLTRFTRFNESGKIIFSTQKQYNKQGLLVAETTQEGIDEETTTIVVTYTYNKQGKLTKQLQQSLSGKPLFEVNFSYNNKSLPQKVISYDYLTGLLTIEEYQYYTVN